MEKVILEKIKKAEKEAGRIIENAERKKERIILDAETRAEDLEKREMDRLKNEISEKIKSFEQKTEEEKEIVLGETRLEMEKLRKMAVKNVDKALQSLEKEFFNFLER
jgi:vacuolar-type H+-ATPase subunit H